MGGVSLMIGPKTELIQFQQSTESDNADLERVSSWGSYISRWGSVVAGSGSDDDEGADRIEPRQSWRVFVWLDSSTSQINPTFRILWRGRYLEIISAAPVDSKRREMVFDCVEHITGLNAAVSAGS